MPSIPALRRQRQAGLCEFKAILVYSDSKAARAAKRNPDLKKKKKKERKKERKRKTNKQKNKPNTNSPPPPHPTPAPPKNPSMSLSGVVA